MCLHDGLGVPRIGESPDTGHNGTQELIDGAGGKGFLNPFTSVNKIGGVEVSWTLGKIVLFASGSIAPMDTSVHAEDIVHAVGFGPNTDDLYTDGQFYTPAGMIKSSSAVVTASSGKGFLGRVFGNVWISLFYVSFCLTLVSLVAILLYMGPERRRHMWWRLHRALGRQRKIMGARGTYERLDASSGFDLADEDVEIEPIYAKNMVFGLNDWKTDSRFPAVNGSSTKSDRFSGTKQISRDGSLASDLAALGQQQQQQQQQQQRATYFAGSSSVPGHISRTNSGERMTAIAHNNRTEKRPRTPKQE